MMNYLAIDINKKYYCRVSNHRTMKFKIHGSANATTTKTFGTIILIPSLSFTWATAPDVTEARFLVGFLAWQAEAGLTISKE